MPGPVNTENVFEDPNVNAKVKRANDRLKLVIKSAKFLVDMDVGFLNKNAK